MKFMPRISELAQQPVRIAKQAGGGAGAKIVVFSVDSYTPETAEQEDYPGEQGVAICTPRYLMCGGSIPGRDEYGKISVYDPMACLFDEEEGELAGRWGYAAWMKPTLDEAVRIGEADDSYEYSVSCRWVALGLCCADSAEPE